MTLNEARRTLRRLELEAYAAIVSAFRAEGQLTLEKKASLTQLSQLLSISADRHHAEIRRAICDESLSYIADCVCGLESKYSWLPECRRLVRGNPRLVSRQAISTPLHATILSNAKSNVMKNDVATEETDRKLPPQVQLALKTVTGQHSSAPTSRPKQPTSTPSPAVHTVASQTEPILPELVTIGIQVDMTNEIDKEMNEQLAAESSHIEEVPHSKRGPSSPPEDLPPAKRVNTTSPPSTIDLVDTKSSPDEFDKDNDDLLSSVIHSETTFISTTETDSFMTGEIPSSEATSESFINDLTYLPTNEAADSITLPVIDLVSSSNNPILTAISGSCPSTIDHPAPPAIDHLSPRAIDHLSQPSIDHLSQPSIDHLSQPTCIINHLSPPAIDHLSPPAIDHLSPSYITNTSSLPNLQCVSLIMTFPAPIQSPTIKSDSLILSSAHPPTIPTIPTLAELSSSSSSSSSSSLQQTSEISNTEPLVTTSDISIVDENVLLEAVTIELGVDSIDPSLLNMSDLLSLLQPEDNELNDLDLTTTDQESSEMIVLQQSDGLDIDQGVNLDFNEDELLHDLPPELRETVQAILESQSEIDF